MVARRLSSNGHNRHFVTRARGVEPRTNALHQHVPAAAIGELSRLGNRTPFDDVFNRCGATSGAAGRSADRRLSVSTAERSAAAASANCCTLERKPGAAMGAIGRRTIAASWPTVTLSVACGKRSAAAAALLVRKEQNMPHLTWCGGRILVV
jgi:hypothetical protein